MNIRYRVVAPCFVNGSLIEPAGRKDVFVTAAEGLAGPALELAPEAEALARPDPAPAPQVKAAATTQMVKAELPKRPPA